MAELLHGDVTYDIIGAALEVHRELGPGFLENAYQRAMETELRNRKLEFAAQHRICVQYKTVVVADHFLDLVVDGKVVVELKAVKEMNEHHRAQVISYLKATALRVGLLINFAKASLEHRRVLLSDALNPRNPCNPL